MKSHRTVIRGPRLLAGADLKFSNQPCDVVIEAGHIAAIKPVGEVRANADEVVMLEDCVLAPGLINGHQHSHEHFQKGRTENLPLELWQHMVRGRCPVQLTPRQAYLRTMIGAIESLRTGCTTMVDDLSLGVGVDPEVVEAILQAYDDSGLRVMLGFAMMDKPMVDNFPFVDELLPKELLRNLRAAQPPDPQALVQLVKKLARDGRHPQGHRVSVLVSASAPQRCTTEYLMQLRALADELDLPLITHVQETRLQVVTGLQFYGKPIVEYLDSIGFLKPRTSLVHAVWLNPREIEALARSGATAQHNPWSNLLLGSGVQPVRELLDAGVNVSLGSDGGCSTVTLNMLQVLGSAAGISKLRGDDSTRWLSAKQAWQAGTQGGAKALGFEGQLGCISEGMKADLVAYRCKSLSLTPLNDPLRQLAYAERGAGIEFVMVDGKVVLKQGALTQINEGALIDEIAECFNTLKDLYAQAEADAQPVIDAMQAVYKRALGLPVPTDTYQARLS